MKILVAVKRVIDYNVQIRVKEDNTGVVTDNVKMSTNPPDDNAIEEAVKIKEAGKATEVVAVSIGEEKAQETVRKALAVGADRGILVKTEGIIEPLAVSKLLQKIVEKEKPDLVFMGKQAIDDDCNQTGQMLSALLNWPQATFASKIEIKDGKLEVTREIDEGLETIEIKWVDQIRGEIKWQGKDLGGDLVLSRRAMGYEIGDPLYNLAVVVDDNFMNITHVVRGEDHISNTAKQILIYEALNFNLPTFSHTPLILNSEGKKLSKRDCVTSIDEFKDMGYLPEALSNYMAFLGWSPKSADREILSLDEISKIFDLSDINKAVAKFSCEKLNWINSQYIKNMESVKLTNIISSYWDDMGWEPPSEEWAIKLAILIRDSMTLLKDAIDQSKPFFLLPPIQKEGKNFLENMDSKASLKLILNYLIEQKTVKLDKEKAKEIINEISKRHNVKKGILMKSLRVAFFGCLSGPDLIQSWELLSENKSDLLRIERCFISP